MWSDAGLASHDLRPEISGFATVLSYCIHTTFILQQCYVPFQMMNVHLTKLPPFSFDRQCRAVSVTSVSQIILTGEKHDEQVITIRDEMTGNVVKEITSKCPELHEHFLYRQVTEHPTDSNYIIESCPLCRTIRSYNVHSGDEKIIFDTCKPVTMCAGPDQTLLVLDDKKQLLQLQWNKENTQLELIDSVKTDVKVHHYAVSNRMCYVKQQNICVFTSYHFHSIAAVKCSAGSTLWEVSGEINGRKIEPDGVTCDDIGRVYVPDGGRSRLLVFGSFDGGLHQEIELERMGYIRDICRAEHQLTVLHDNNQDETFLTLFDINQQV